METWLVVCNIVVAVLTVGSFVFSIFAFRKSGKRFELSHAERESMMRWYSETMDCLMALKFGISSDKDFDKTPDMGKLSSLVEQGRFFFPNRLDGSGAEKPSAYRGTRDIGLDMLVYYLRICERPDANARIRYLESIERTFTSRVFDVMNPREYNRQAEKATFLKPRPDETTELGDFLDFDLSKGDFWNSLY
jgi:hypothetical protein